MQLTRQRIQQIEEEGLVKMRASGLPEFG
jgi:DNA-directed RNA polymerase sigma subunit (sigma70/sigma32)